MDAETGDYEPDRLSDLHSGNTGPERTIVEVGTRKRPLLAWISQLAAVVVGIVIVVIVLQVVYGQDTTHQDLTDRLELLEDEARFQSCLLQFIPEERTERVIAECQLKPIPDATG